MAKYLLVSFKTCPWVQRAAIVLREKNTRSSSATSSRTTGPTGSSPSRRTRRCRCCASTTACRCSNRTRSTNISTRRSRRGCIRTIRCARHQPRLDRLRADLRRQVTGVAYADDEAAYNEGGDKIPVAFERLESALENRAAGPCSTARNIRWSMPPMRRSCSAISSSTASGRSARSRNIPRLKAWADTLMKRPSTHSFPEAEFEALYRLNVKRRNKWLSQFIADPAVAAE